MRILGIDPGYAIVGFGVADYSGMNFTYYLFYLILEKFEPDCLSIEKLFFTNNQKTAIDVAQARGVIVLSAVRHGISIYEYTPLQVKQAVVGYGKAEKKQVMDMTRRILKLEQIPKPDDAADALALAICHGHCCKGIR